MQTEITQTHVTYQAQSKLLELGDNVAKARSWTKDEVKSDIALGTKIRLWLKALQYSDYLEQDTINKLVYCLSQICEANAIPYSPSITTVSAPSILVGIPGQRGEQGAEGPEGGGVPFSSENITIDTIVDSFSISDAEGVDYTFAIYGSSGKRIGRLLGGWKSDGSLFNDDAEWSTGDIYGDTTPVTMSLNVSGTTAQLFAQVTSGTWTIKGTRKYIPNNGNGIVQPSSLADGKIWIGDSVNTPISQTITGDISITSAGVASITTGVIVNADINASAAIDTTKLSALTASRAVVSNGSGYLAVSATTSTQIGYLSNVTSDVQAQLDSKLSGATGAISTVTSSDLTANRLVISNALGKIAVGPATISGNDVTFSGRLALNSPLTAETDITYTNTVGQWEVGTNNDGNGTSSNQFFIYDSSYRFTVQRGTGRVGIGTASPGYLLDVSGQINNTGGISFDGGSAVKEKIVAFPSNWDMDTNSTFSVPHGLGGSVNNIVGIEVMVKGASTFTRPLSSINSFSGAIQGGVTTVDAININLYRLAGGDFDTTVGGYNNSSGYVKITYIA